MLAGIMPTKTSVYDVESVGVC